MDHVRARSSAEAELHGIVGGDARGTIAIGCADVAHYCKCGVIEDTIFTAFVTTPVILMDAAIKGAPRCVQRV